jgi:phosphoribosyl 1,2-cyclic phosphate phosphodiesterase
MEIIFLGTGTSHGIPVVGCGCGVCKSTDRKNKRTRASLLVRESGRSILIDTATEFRIQAVRENITSLDAVLYTHPHADHLHGLDDIRPLTQERIVPLYGNRETIEEIKVRFGYIFSYKQLGGGVPRIEFHEVSSKVFYAAGVPVLPVPIKHGVLDILGYRIGNMAYLTDCSGIPEGSYPLLADLDLLVLGALRYRPHGTHFSVKEALHEIDRIKPKRALLTHFCHDIDHGEIKKELPRGVAPSYDGLRVALDR